MDGRYKTLDDFIKRHKANPKIVNGTELITPKQVTTKFSFKDTLLARVKVTCSLSTYLIRQLPLNDHFLSVTYRREAHLILELYLHFSNVAFHYFTYDLICIQVSKIDDLGTCVPFIMVPLLYPVSNALQHASSDACFSS